jgi:hypothetical protein
METLQISKENAFKAYESANDNGKELLSNLFGKQVFSRKVTDRVKSYEDAVNELGFTPTNLATPPTESRDEKSITAYRKLIVIARVLNEGWEPDWDNDDEYKYYPYFDMRSEGAGFGFSFGACTFSHSDTLVGSRLCFKTRELAEYAGKQFQDIYIDYLTL